jgi:uncharacterized membrane protein
MPTIPTYWLVDWAIIAAAMLLAALLTAIVAIEFSCFFMRGTMTCATISYFTAILGALIGFFVANLFQVGGRS